MKDIVKQFKESISKLTTEEFKKVWDEIEAEIGTDYPVFNAKTKCFEYKINNTETIEDSALDYVNSTSITFPEDAVKKAFKSGVEFAQSWVDINKESPQYYQTVLADNRKYMAEVARVSDGDEDFYPICGTDVYMSPDPIKWRPIELK